MALIVAVIVAASVALLAINVWLRGGEFRSQHVGQNPEMRRRGIHCVQSMDARERSERKPLLTETIKRKE